jgi:[ribosomal protein S5]-alanine N-acetyltransferase
MISGGPVTLLQIPTLSTARLRLEPLAMAHSGGMFALWSREEVCRYSGPAVDADGRSIPLPATSPLESDRIIDFFVQRAATGLGFRWAMVTVPDGMFVGAVGYNHLGSCPELAWHLHPDAWGQGLMTEACRAALAWLQGALQVQAFVDPGNEASIRLAERLGFRATGEAMDDTRRYLADLWM